jgi:hypothetical protein
VTAARVAPGTRLRVPGAATEIIVIRPADAVTITCGGEPMSTDAESGTAGGAGSEQVVLGKRYVDADTGLEVLCTKTGPGPLAVNGRPMVQKSAKPLPSSD